MVAVFAGTKVAAALHPALLLVPAALPLQSAVFAGTQAAACVVAAAAPQLLQQQHSCGLPGSGLPLHFLQQ
jgi:hypothetical protein